MLMAWQPLIALQLWGVVIELASGSSKDVAM